MVRFVLAVTMISRSYMPLTIPLFVEVGQDWIAFFYSFKAMLYSWVYGFDVDDEIMEMKGVDEMKMKKMKRTNEKEKKEIDELIEKLKGMKNDKDKNI
jgi:hypothetical protein